MCGRGRDVSDEEQYVCIQGVQTLCKEFVSSLFLEGEEERLDVWRGSRKTPDGEKP